MAALIRPETIGFHARISEEELRQRIADEVLAQVGGLDAEGRRIKGVSVDVGRGADGGYTIDVSGPMPERLLLAARPRGAEG